MSTALHLPHMTRDAFFAWAEARDGRYEFDGFQPVAMTGGTRDHARIALNVAFALKSRLRGSPCETLAQDAGVATIGDAVRYPDVLVTCTGGRGSDRLIPGVVAVFEVLSPTSGRTDRIDKLREYQAVPSIRRYVILEYRSPAVTVFHRDAGTQAWTADALVAEDKLPLPEIGLSIPVAAFFEGVDFGTTDAA